MSPVIMTKLISKKDFQKSCDVMKTQGSPDTTDFGTTLFEKNSNWGLNLVSTYILHTMQNGENQFSKFTFLFEP